MLLDNIRQPRDIQALGIEALTQLAEEIRQFLIRSLAQTGGHLAPNLGVVELTIALHHVYHSPVDQFVFDVGHQAYVHKLLTGRMHRFPTLRAYKGLCGFIKRSESEHDIWEAGHSSTALSAAMGLAIARDASQRNHKVIAIVGDGALTGGMSFEALNHIGDEKKNLIVVLNDNEMSIAPNVGALHHYLAKMRADRRYIRSKGEFRQLLRKFPYGGSTLAGWAGKLKDSLKYLVVPGVLFEELGFTYVGPINGHHFPTLLETFRQMQHVQGPVLVHVVTTKGKGYAPAEADAHTWHGLGGYKVESGEVVASKGPPLYTEVFGNTLIDLATHDERIVAVTPAMPGGSGLLAFGAQFPDRLFDVGIAEQHAATMCAALALAGRKPVFAVYSTFLQRAYDQVVHDIARQRANVVFAIDRAGFVGGDGETHHGVYDIAYLRHIPNMTIMMPQDEEELRHMLYTALQHTAGPVAVRYPRLPGIGRPPQPYVRIPIGAWQVIVEGGDAVVLAVGPMVHIAREAAVSLQTQGISLRVVNARFIKPLDDAMLTALAQQQLPLVTMEEGTKMGGFGSAVLEWMATHLDGCPPRIQVMGIPDTFIEHGSIADQRREAGLTVAHLIDTVCRLVVSSENVR